MPDAGFGDGGVDVIPVGEYEILRLAVADTAALAAWLDTFGYAHTPADLDAIGPYLARGDTITAVRVAVDGPEDGALRPLALTWPGADLRPPLALVRPSRRDLRAHRLPRRRGPLSAPRRPNLVRRPDQLDRSVVPDPQRPRRRPRSHDRSRPARREKHG